MCVCGGVTYFTTYYVASFSFTLVTKDGDRVFTAHALHTISFSFYPCNIFIYLTICHAITVFYIATLRTVWL